ncbi:MAG: hypothetical protein Q9184_008352, partial [Pyrenodesmia sp. 2 TL-2023]
MGFYQMPSGHWLKFDLDWGMRHEFNLILRDDPGSRFLEGIGTADVEALYHQLNQPLSFAARQLAEQGRSESFMEQTASYPQHRTGVLHLSACLPFPHAFPRVGELVPQWVRDLAAVPNTPAVTIMWENPREVRRPDHRFYTNMAFHQMPDREWLIFHLDTGKRTRDFNLVLRDDPGIGYMEGLYTYDVGALLHGLHQGMEMSARPAQVQLQIASNDPQRSDHTGLLDQGSQNRAGRMHVPVSVLNPGPFGASSHIQASEPQAPRPASSTGEQ